MHFVLQSIVLMAAIAISPIPFQPAWIWMIIPAMLVLVLLTAAFSILLSAVNVYARDTQHFLELLLLAWFFLTPVVYQWGLPAQKLQNNGFPTWILLLNPVVPVTLALQRSLYGITHFVSGGVVQPLLPEEGPVVVPAEPRPGGHRARPCCSPRCGCSTVSRPTSPRSSGAHLPVAPTQSRSTASPSAFA